MALLAILNRAERAARGHPTGRLTGPLTGPLSGPLSGPLALALLLFAAAGCSVLSPSPEVPEAKSVRGEIAPTGTLRVAINLGNPVLARRDQGELAGVSVDLARTVGRELNIPITLIPYPSAGKVVAAARDGEWDLAFVARDPKRSADFYQTAPYVLIQGSYLVRSDSPLQHASDVDAQGVRIVVGRGSAYDLYLSRTLRHATLIRVETSTGVVDAWQKGVGDVAAGVTQQLMADQQRYPQTRLLPEAFMTIEQAMAMPLGRPGGERYLEGFVRRQISTGAVAQALARSGVKGAVVASIQE